MTHPAWKSFLFLVPLCTAALLLLPSCDSADGGDISDTGTQTAEPETAITVLDKLETTALDEAYTLVDATSYASAKEGIASGWRLDNTGGVPRTDIEGSYGSLTDVSTTDGTAMIREFNKVSSGILTLETSVRVTAGFDGFSLQFRGESDAPVYTLITRNGGWSIVNPDGSETALSAEESSQYAFRIVLNLDTGTAETVINDVSMGTSELLSSGEDCNIVNFRFATDDEGTAAATFGRIRITANYAVNADFAHYTAGEAPYDFTTVGTVKVTDSQLSVREGSAEKTFTPIEGTVLADTEFILSNGQTAAFAVGASGYDVVTFTTNKTDFYANGVKIYENYVQNVWYSVRIEAHTDTDTAVIWVNGRKAGEVPFAVSTDYLDSVRVANESKIAVPFDGIHVQRKITHDDYVPEPVIPAGQEDYTVGINVCSLWREGTHYGWGTITPYDDAEPVLGYYDEGSPETADWEIKYMVEHGIDFQAFCWYANTSDGPIHPTHLYEQLHDGYMYAEYSDYMKYCLIWEASNASRPDGLEAWKDYYVPYFIEHYFRDSRYMTIDDQLVLCVFGTNKLADAFGGADKVAEGFAYLEEEVKKLGFDGMIYLACGSSSDELANMGFDGSYAYNWGSAGSEVSVNQTSILNSAAVTSMYTVPTVSVGFNSIPWHGVRYPMMTVDDYETAHLWVRNEYLPAYADAGTWQENFVMLSTWNEYGEGTYIMPSAGNGGFGYLDVLRNIYTGEDADESLNVVPTAEQRERINHLYPQYRQVLRKQGYAAMEVDESALDVLETLDFTSKKNKSHSSMKEVQFTEDGMTGYADGDALVVTNKLNVAASDTQYLRVTVDVPRGTTCEIFFITDKDNSWAADKGTRFAATEDGLSTYLVDMTTVSTWQNTVTAIRIDPGQCTAGTGTPEANYFRIVSIECLGKPADIVETVFINDQEVSMQLPVTRSEDTLSGTKDGLYLIAFDPKIALDYRLNAFHTWDKASQSLTLDIAGHTVVYTVGADTYLLDGAEKPLGYTLYTEDGLPMIPITTLCGDVGYPYTEDENGILHIETSQYEYFTGITDREAGKWEFNTNGDAEGWSSSHMSLSVIGGTMTAMSSSDYTDPTIPFGTDVDLESADYVAMEIRCRYAYNSDYAQALCMYFTTSFDGTMSESMTIKAQLSSTDSGDEWETYRIDLTDNPGWQGTIKKLRFDPFNAVGTMEIDYIRFLREGE
ncbi:MAG: glycoside hydrolase family 99-like domain-containing protein [Clostridia bacterium]|nr:glycoside hydrolase family 99-like domain-containing protein [Clostridia bacterium]